jgi:hypothetical protein
LRLIQDKEGALADLMDAQGKIDRQLFGPPVTVGGRLLQPVARMTGHVQGAGGGVQVTPVQVKALDPQGGEQTLPIFDLTRQTLRSIMGVGLALAAVCSAVIVLRSLIPCRNQAA